MEYVVWLLAAAVGGLAVGWWLGSATEQSRVIDLVVENERLRFQIAGHCERIAAQSDLLSRRAEK